MVLAACAKVKKAFNSFGTIRIKSPFVELYKECTVCANLRVNTLICQGATEAKTCCTMQRRGALIMQIPQGYQKKSCLRRKSAILSVRWKFQCKAKIIVALFL